MKDKHKYTTAVQCLAIAACIVLLGSCLSFDIGDAPSPYVYPHNSPAQNWCGPVGAFCAYYLLYYIGPGVYIILLSAAAVLTVKLAGRRPNQPVLRALGLVILTAAASAAFFLLGPKDLFGFPTGPGGILGAAAGVFLRSHLALLGTTIVMVGAAIVGTLLLADNVLLGALHLCTAATGKVFGVARPALSEAKRHSSALNEIWQKLRARQLEAESAAGTAAGLASAAAPAAEAAPEKRSLRQRLREYKARKTAQIEQPAPAPAVEKTAPAPAAAPKSQDAACDEGFADYVLPPIELLAEPQRGPGGVQQRIVKAKASVVENLLQEFAITAHVVAAETGPVITLFELELAPGVKVSQISNLANDIARALGAPAVRVVAPLPGKHTIGIEVPNSEKEKVRIRELLQLSGTRPDRMQLPVFLGKDSAGEALVSDLTTMPHLLIAGTTGSGKSVCINSIITSLLLRKRPDEVKLILIDPKMVEMTAFNAVPHLMCPIVTEIRRAVQILEWATEKMDERYALLAEARVKNIAAYNGLTEEEIEERFQPGSEEEKAKIPRQLPYIVIVVDELADLMMTAGKELEGWIVRLAQKSRAVGIHLVLATQRPQATVVTGLIKSNMPCRISFRVAAKMDSRIILDQNGAETLLGEGDMLFLRPGTSDPIRAQGSLVDESEVRSVAKHLRRMAEPKFHPELTRLTKIDPAEMRKDELFDDAVRMILETQRGSVSLLQRRLNIGYARASRIIEMMASAGILGEYKGSQAREVTMTLEQYEQMRREMFGEPSETAGDEDTEQSSPSASQAGATAHNEAEYGYISVNNQNE